MHIYTINACPRNEDKINCVVESDNATYNLTALSYQNYIIKNGNIDYIINICNAIAMEENILCPSSSGVCLRNNTEPNLKKR